MNTGDCTHTFQNKRITSKRGLSAIDVSPCGKYIVCGYLDDEWIRKFDVVSQKLIMKTSLNRNDSIGSIRYSPNGQLIASGSENSTIKIWDAQTLEQFGNTLFGHEDEVWSVAFSPDSKDLVSTSQDGTIRLWDCQIQEQIGPNIKVRVDVESVQYSPSGLQIISAGYYGIDIWDSTTREQLLHLTSSYSNSAVYSLDGRYIVSSCFHTIQLWDANNGQQIGDNLVGHCSSIRSLAFSPDSSLIVSGSSDRTVRLWNSATGKQEAILHTYHEEVKNVAFSKDGRYVISGSGDGTISIVKMKL